MNNYFVLGGFSAPCVSGGHTPGEVVVTRVGYNGRRTGERTCSKCGAVQRVLEYAASVKRRK
jgi:hypothetical protein